LKNEAFSPVPGQEVYITISIGLAQYNFKEDMKAFVQLRFNWFNNLKVTRNPYYVFLSPP
ncbi:MAG: hypothetical protein PHV90_10065, partial [Smithella sp.]|nr:hypothetical protein [Smithella sp.]